MNKRQIQKLERAVKQLMPDTYRDCFDVTLNKLHNTPKDVTGLFAKWRPPVFVTSQVIHKTLVDAGLAEEIAPLFVKSCIRTLRQMADGMEAKLTPATDTEDKS